MRASHSKDELTYHHMFPITNPDAPMPGLVGEAREQLAAELERLRMKRVGPTRFHVTEDAVYVQVSVAPVDKRARLGIDQVAAVRVVKAS